jgi:hypothetical protein
MGGKTRETFNKRQKERARQEKQRDKIAKRQQRRSDRPDAATGPEIDWTSNDDSLPADKSVGDDI